MASHFKKKFNSYAPPEKNKINHQIRATSVLLIDENGAKIGAVSLTDALKRAEVAELDLVEIAPNARPPVCKILNYSKFKYELLKKEKEAKQNQKTSQLKELRLTPRIGDHDLEIKCKCARDFLDEGHKVQFKLKYKNRELAHKEIGFEVMKKIAEQLKECCLSTGPKMDGNTLICILEPKTSEKA